MPSAAALIRQQAQEIDALWDRLSHAYALVRRESPTEMIQEETEALGPCSTSDGIRNYDVRMQLTICPTGLGAGINQGRPDYSIFCSTKVLRRELELRAQ
jgi:hypothetical protein